MNHVEIRRCIIHSACLWLLLLHVIWCRLSRRSLSEARVYSMCAHTAKRMWWHHAPQTTPECGLNGRVSNVSSMHLGGIHTCASSCPHGRSDVVWWEVCYVSWPDYGRNLLCYEFPNLTEWSPHKVKLSCSLFPVESDSIWLLFCFGTALTPPQKTCLMEKVPGER